MSRPASPSSTPGRAPGPPPDSNRAAGSPGQGQSALPTSTGTASRWRPGDGAEVWVGGMLRHRGVVEDSAAHLGVVWIREMGTGLRILVDLSDTEMQPPPAQSQVCP